MERSDEEIVEDTATARTSASSIPPIGHGYANISRTSSPWPSWPGTPRAPGSLRTASVIRGPLLLRRGVGRSAAIGLLPPQSIASHCPRPSVTLAGTPPWRTTCSSV
jgi:hypothetical protein